MRPSPRFSVHCLCVLLLFPSTAWGGRIKDAMAHAVRDPRTWVPAAGAVLLAATGYDSQIAHRAARETPVFGSPERARQASNDLRTATHLGMLATCLLPPVSEHERGRLPRLLAQTAATTAATNSASLFKRIARRTRPDGSDDLSLPSGHATSAFAYAAMGAGNLAASDLPRGLQRGLSIGLTTLAAGSAWARVEGGVHYPSDVLAGAALGSFVSSLVNDAILPSDSSPRVSVSLSASGGEVWLRWSF